MLKNEDLTITNRENKSPYILVLGPTRELVEQIYNCALITSLGLNIKYPNARVGRAIDVNKWTRYHVGLTYA